MSEHPFSPESLLQIAGKEITWPGDFACIGSLEQVLKKDVLDIHADIPEMRTNEFVRMLSVMAASAGEKLSEVQIGNWVQDEVGIGTFPYIYLKKEVMAALSLALAPKEGRAKKKTDLQVFLARQKQSLDSLGENTGNSASAPSDGLQPNSGAQPSGT